MYFIDESIFLPRILPSEENQKKLFNVKKNFTTIGTENEKGTGLGLTICKDLVELNNGRIWVESTPNIGSKFYIELPKAQLS
jgi:signal transduction histidine kinase